MCDRAFLLRRGCGLFYIHARSCALLFGCHNFLPITLQTLLLFHRLCFFGGFTLWRLCRHLHRKLGESLLIPVHMGLFLFAHFPDRLGGHALQLGVGDLWRNRSQHVPVPMIFGLGQNQVLDIVKSVSSAGTCVESRPSALWSAASAPRL